MAKIIDYPRASFKSCLDVASAIDSLGGKCISEMAAEKLGKKLSGAWTAQVAATIKFGLITNIKGTLVTSSLYRDYKLGYNETERKTALANAFMLPPIFKQITERFEGMELPISHFEKLLIREFNVPEEMASRVAKYYIDGAKLTGILEPNGLINGSPTIEKDADNEDEVNPIDSNTTEASQPAPDFQQFSKQEKTLSSNSNQYSVHIAGPGMDSLITINDPEDLLIVNVILSKIGKQLQADTNS